MVVFAVSVLLGGPLMGAPAESLDMPGAVARNAAWAEGAFGPVRTGEAVSHVTLVREEGPGDTKVGRCAAGGPLRLGDQVYTRGIGVNSYCALRVSLSGPAERLRAVIGLDRNVDGTPGSVRFHVVVGGTAVSSTDVIRAGDPPQDLDVSLNGATEFDLVVDDGDDGRGWDQGDWADARVTLSDGTELWLDDLARVSVPLPALPFSFTYGGRPSSELLPGWERSDAVEEVDDGRLLRTLTLTDPQTRLEVVATATVYTDTPGVDWTLTFTNTGEADSPVLADVLALDSTVAPGLGSQVTLHRLNGSPCLIDDWLPFEQPVPPGARIEMTSEDGRPSSDRSPYFGLDWGSGGVITAVGWSGRWNGLVDRSEGAVRLGVGLQDLRVSLHPGESIRSPRILQIYWSGDDEWAGYNLFRRTVLAHISPRIDGEVVLPPVTHLTTSFYELNATTEDDVLSHLRSLDGLGFEVLWLDAYWTGPDGFPNAMGNYGLPLESVEPPDRFPNGLRRIGREVRDAGLGFLLWFEPERVAPGTRIAREHPEWVISPAGDGSGLLNLGIPEAREYMTEYLDAAIREYGLSWLRFDYNINPLPFWQFADQGQPDRAGMTEMRYVEGVYRMWDDLRAAHPGLAIDTCSSGGRRMDLEACSRALGLWRSDNTCDMIGEDPAIILKAAIENQVMSGGLNRYLPLTVVGQMGSDPYRFRSGFNGGIAFCEDIRGADYPRDQLRDAIAEGKRIRKYWFGDFYALSDITTSPRDWCVFQYHRPEERDGIVLAFRRENSPYAAYDCRLRGIDPDATYRVTFSSGYEPEPPVTLRGSQLDGLVLTILKKPGSVLVEYEEL